MIKKIATSLVFALGVAGASQAQAETLTAPVLAQCLLSAATEDDETKMKNFLVNALLENKEETQKALLEVGMLVAQRSMITCGADIKDLESPAFEKALSEYHQAKEDLRQEQGQVEMRQGENAPHLVLVAGCYQNALNGLVQKYARAQTEGLYSASEPTGDTTPSRGQGI